VICNEEDSSRHGLAWLTVDKERILHEVVTPANSILATDQSDPELFVSRHDEIVIAGLYAYYFTSRIPSL